MKASDLKGISYQIIWGMSFGWILRKKHKNSESYGKISYGLFFTTLFRNKKAVETLRNSRLSLLAHRVSPSVGVPQQFNARYLKHFSQNRFFFLLLFVQTGIHKRELSDASPRNILRDTEHSGTHFPEHWIHETHRAAQTALANAMTLNAAQLSSLAPLCEQPLSGWWTPNANKRQDWDK